ncbi:hypothetical protein [Embleya sp. MST-111070]|uniref:hypothetical protein n=1 Tax=Embleya sp. MST-111070 TaxID=3398231 RepID=UPI003F738E05
MSDFTDAVAKRAGASTEDVARTLEHHNVRESGLLPRPRRLSLSSVRFRGEKSGKATGTFDFDWTLDDGLWCLAADNLKGKSTVLDVIWWCLRGRNSRLQTGVRAWITDARLAGRIDDEPFVVTISQSEGRLTGSLQTGDREHTVTFDGDAQFEAVMNEFMMDRLGLEILRSWRKDDPKDGDDGKAVVTTWPSFSHALMCRNRKPGILLGESVQDGGVVSLLQMFIGLPWTTTRRDADAALNAVRQQSRGETRRATQDAQARTESLRQLRETLAAAEQALDNAQQEPSLEDRVTSLEKAGTQLAEATTLHTRATHEHTTAQSRAEEIHQALLDDQKALRDLRENAAARRHFGSLTPTCCPRCATAVTDLPHAHDTDQCEVCGTASPPTVPADATAVEQLTAGIATLRDADRQAREAVRLAQAKRDATEAALASARRDFDAARIAMPGKSHLRLHLDVERLRGALDERAKSQAHEDRPPQATLEERILEAAQKEADKRVQTQSKPLLGRINEEIKTLAQRLGYTALQGVRLQGNATMRLKKDDGDTSFSAVSDGEQLRLRIATLLALLRVGRTDGGRHPGLLLLDSVGAQEVNPADLAETLQHLKTICAETPGLQIIAATANRDLARSVVPQDRLRYAPPGQYMW